MLAEREPLDVLDQQHVGQAQRGQAQQPREAVAVVELALTVAGSAERLTRRGGPPQWRIRHQVVACGVAEVVEVGVVAVGLGAGDGGLPVVKAGGGVPGVGESAGGSPAALEQHDGGGHAASLLA